MQPESEAICVDYSLLREDLDAIELAQQRLALFLEAEVPHGIAHYFRMPAADA